MPSQGRKTVVFVLCSSHICITVTTPLFLAPQMNGGFPNFALILGALKLPRVHRPLLEPSLLLDARSCSNPVQFNALRGTKDLVVFCLFVFKEC